MVVKREEGFFVNKRNQKLRDAKYIPEGEVKAVLVIHAGYREHIGYGVPVYKKIASAGYALFHMEAHGHGLSEPQEPAYKKFTMDSFFHYTDDYSQYVEEVVKTHPLVKEKNLPIFCGGDSMGGQLTAMLAILHKSEFKGILLTCPSIDVERNIIMNIQLLFSEVLFRTMPYKRLVPAIPLEDVTDEPEVRERIEKDELYEKGNVAVKAAYQFLKGFKFLREHEHELTLPILVVIGSNDKVVNMNAIERFMKNVQSKDATMTKVMGGCHQLLDGSKVDEYVNAIVGWLDTHYK